MAELEHEAFAIYSKIKSSCSGLGGTGIWMGITLAFVFAVALLTPRLSRAFARFRRDGE